MMKFLRLDFIPSNVDLGLLILRAWLGLSMLWLHGLVKLQGFSQMSKAFPNYLGIGRETNLALAVFAEFVCAGLLVIGLFTRLSAFMLAFTMGVAFFVAHKGALKGSSSGEMAFIFMAGFVALFFTGPGRYSVDGKGKGGGGSGGAKKSKPSKSSE